MFLNRTRNILGLDIGSHAIKMVALRSVKGDVPVELTHFGVAELPDDAIVDGAVVDRAAIIEVLSGLLGQHKVRIGRVATSVSGNAVIVRRVSMEHQSEEQLRERLPDDAEQYIPFELDDVDLDFAILGDDEADGSMDVVLVAAKRERVDEYVGLVEGVDKTAAILDVDAFAVQNAFEFSYPERQFEDVAILNLGASMINMAVLEGGRPVFWRDIAVGMGEYVAALQRQFMLDAFDAEEVLRRLSRRDNARGVASTLADWSAAGEEGNELGDAADDPRVAEVVSEVSDRVIAEIRKTFDFYQSQTDRDHFDAVFLSGGGAHIRVLSDRLEERLGFPVEVFDPMRRVSIPEGKFDRDYIAESAPEAAVAFGLALRGVTG